MTFFTSAPDRSLRESVRDSGGHGIHTAFLIALEGLVLFGLPVLAERLTLVDFHAWPVHPYLYVTLLFAAEYGVAGALLSVSVGTAASWISGWPERPLDMGYQEFFMSLWAQPLSWLVAGLLVGIVTSGRARALRTQGELLDRSRTAERLIAGQHEVLAARVRKLEQGLAGLDSSVPEPLPLPASPKPRRARRSRPAASGGERP